MGRKIILSGIEVLTVQDDTLCCDYYRSKSGLFYNAWQGTNMCEERTWTINIKTVQK